MYAALQVSMFCHFYAMHFYTPGRKPPCSIAL